MLLAFGGLKGGTGKTTLAVAVASEVAARGRRTLLLDADPRRDAVSWSISAHAEAPTTLALPADVWTRPEMLRELAMGFDLTVLDLGSGQPELQQEAFSVCDVVLIPCGPHPFEVWSALDSLELVTRAKARNPGVEAAVVINRTDPRATLSEALPRDLLRRGTPMLRTHLGRRAVHAEAMAHGSTAAGYEPKSAGAQELGALVDELELFRPVAAAAH